MKREREGLTEWIRRESGWVPYYVERAPSEGKAPWSTIWFDIEQNRQAKATLTRILGIDVDFQTPQARISYSASFGHARGRRFGCEGTAPSKTQGRDSLWI